MPSAESCYKVIYERDNWYSAGWKCQDLVQGSHLAYISSATENTVVKTFLASELSSMYKYEHDCAIPTHVLCFDKNM